VFSAGSRPACIYAARLEAAARYQRLGYRTASDYATEELGLTGRAFRDMAGLGERLEELPAIRRAFLQGQITRTQAQIIGGIATPDDEVQWVTRAEASTVRELKTVAREARQSAADSASAQKEGAREDRPGSASTELEEADSREAAGPPAIETSIAARPTEPRQRCALPMPGWMVGKMDAVLELTAQVAGANVPLGTRLEYVAAEFLSGAEASVGGADGSREEVSAQANEDSSDVPEGALAAAPSSPVEPGPPEDPNGYRRILEKESGRWSFLPAARSPVLMKGSWSSLAEECVELSKNLEGDDGDAGSDASSGHTDDSAGSRHGGRRDETLWSIHRKLKNGLRRERTAAWQLGRLLSLIHNRWLWKDMMFCSFSHYVSERLGISSRVAQRLIRLDRHCWDHPQLAVSYQRGELSLLKAEMLLRVVRLSIVDDRAERAWVEYAKRSTFQRLTEAVQWAELQCTVSRSDWNRPVCLPPRDSENLRPSIDGGGADAGGPAHASPMFVSGTVGGRGDSRGGDPGDESRAGHPDSPSPMFVAPGDAVVRAEDEVLIRRLGLSPRSASFVDEIPGCDRSIWLTDEEREVLDRAIAAVMAIRGPDWPRWACLNDLLDHFLYVYDAEEFKAMRRKYPLFERDGWRCRVPGCGAHEALHLHHIVFRSHGGSDDPRNLTTLCDFHHLSLHRGWIRCRGRAPHELYWELGVPEGSQHGAHRGERAEESAEGPSRRPIARIFGHRRLRDHEWWDGVQVRVVGDRAEPPGGSSGTQAA